MTQELSTTPMIDTPIVDKSLINMSQTHLVNSVTDPSVINSSTSLSVSPFTLTQQVEKKVVEHKELESKEQMPEQEQEEGPLEMMEQVEPHTPSLKKQQIKLKLSTPLPEPTEQDFLNLDPSICWAKLTGFPYWPSKVDYYHSYLCISFYIC